MSTVRFYTTLSDIWPQSPININAPAFFIRLTRAGPPCCVLLWSNGGPSTVAGPAGSPAVDPVAQRGQWECHLHPRGWGEKDHLLMCLVLLLSARMCVSPTILRRCREPALPVWYPHLSPQSPSPASREDLCVTTLSLAAVEMTPFLHVCIIYQYAPPHVLPEGYGRPKSEAIGEQFPTAEAPLDPRMDLCLSVTRLQGGLRLSDRSR